MSGEIKKMSELRKEWGMDRYCATLEKIVKFKVDGWIINSLSFDGDPDALKMYKSYMSYGMGE